MMVEQPKIRTGIGGSSADRIVFHGLDLCDEILGKTDLGSFAFLCATGRQATTGQGEIVTAVMLASADHGFTPSSLATRLTYLGAPESVQAAIAAGLLGGGSVYLGASQFVGEMLGRLTKLGPPSEFTQIALGEVARTQRLHERIPGFGHPIHRPVDPRTPVLFELARSNGYYGDGCQLMEAVHSSLETAVGRSVTLNAAGASGAILYDVGIEPRMTGLLVLAARAIGLISHIREESISPVAETMWKLVLQNSGPMD